MRFDILTIFPKSLNSYLKESIIARAKKAKLIEIHIHDIRSFSKEKHKKTDDIPYGGGAGMVMTPQPLYDAIKHVKNANHGPVIYLSAAAKTFTQPIAEKLAKRHSLKPPQNGIILICGRYEGIDQRIIDLCVDLELSIGKYVLTGGELPAMVVLDAITRLIPGVLGKNASHENDSFSKNLNRKKEHPHYTRPEKFEGLKVPEVLLGGHHKKIENWRKQHLK